MPICANQCLLCREPLPLPLHQTKTKRNMEQVKTTYDTLPERIDYLISEIEEIKGILAGRIEKPEEIPKFMDKCGLLKYATSLGVAMSESKLYKMTSRKEIPVHKNGSRIYFLVEEIDKWLDEQIMEKESSAGHSFIENIIKSNTRTNKTRKNELYNRQRKRYMCFLHFKWSN